MKVTIEVDLNDIWPECEAGDYYEGYGSQSNPIGTLGRQVEAAIAEEVTQKVWNLVKDQVNKKITDHVYNMVESQVSAKIDAYTEVFLSTGNLTKGRSEPISIKDYIESFITEQKVWSSFSASLAKTAEKFALEVQKKYDMVFATQIVVNLKNSGMLAQDKLDALLTNKD